MLEVLQYQFIQNAVYASLLISILCGLVGTYVVSRRIVFIAGGVTHASFGGIGIGYFLGIHPLVGAAVFSTIAANIMHYFTGSGKLREDSAIGILWSFGMALGIIFIFITPGTPPNLMSYLFGNLLTVSSRELLMMLILAIVVVLFFVVFYRLMIAIAFDESYAKSLRLPVHFINYSLMTLIALVIVITIKAAGIILVMSYLTIPQSTSNLFFNDFRKIALGSIVISLLGSVVGLVISYLLNVPTGASVITVFVVLFLVARLVTGFLNKRKQDRGV